MEEKKDLTRIDVNIEKMPVVFFGTKEKKRSLEKKIFESGKPYELFSFVEGGVVRKLSVAPNAAYGLLTEFDQDIVVVVFYHLYESTKRDGHCPREFRIPMSKFPKIMCIKKHGRLYKDIETAARRISSFEIYHDKYVTVKEKGGELRTYDKESLELFHCKGIHKEERETKKGKKIQKYYLELEIPDWVANNIENFYTTEFDIKQYFTVGGGRARKLYRLLELIRYNETVAVSYEKLQRDLWIEEKELFHVRRTLKRNLTPLVKSGYLTAFEFNEDSVVVNFSSVKKRTQYVQLTFDEMAREEGLVAEMLEKLGDVKSTAFYHKVVKMYPNELIYKCLSLTREVAETTGIKKSKGAVFTDILKRESQKMGLESL